MSWKGSGRITGFKNDEKVFLVPRAVYLGIPATLKNPDINIIAPATLPNALLLSSLHLSSVDLFIIIDAPVKNEKRGKAEENGVHR